MQGSANLNLMIKAARRAGKALVKDFREVENLQVSTKGPGDFVTKADREAERIIKEDLMGGRPTYGWLGEETGETAGQDPTRRWIVDPLDGTTNFLHGMPHWAVSIALEHKGEIVSAVVFDAAKDEMFWAEKGSGAWKTLPATLADLARLMPACAGMRRWGVASLDLAYVAAGRFDGFWERELQPWDIAAGLLLVKEAGGLVGPVREGYDILEKGALICANENLFAPLTKIIRDA